MSHPGTPTSNEIIIQNTSDKATPKSTTIQPKHFWARALPSWGRPGSGTPPKESGGLDGAYPEQKCFITPAFIAKIRSGQWLHLQHLVFQIDFWVDGCSGLPLFSHLTLPVHPLPATPGIKPRVGREHCSDAHEHLFTVHRSRYRARGTARGTGIGPRGKNAPRGPRSWSRARFRVHGTVRAIP